MKGVLCAYDEHLSRVEYQFSSESIAARRLSNFTVVFGALVLSEICGREIISLYFV